MEKTKASTKKRKPWIKVILITVAVLVLAGASGFLFLQAKMSKINPYVPAATIAPEDESFEADEQAAADSDVVDPAAVTWPEDIEQITSPDIINILLIGQDRESGKQRQRSDTMIILSYSKTDKTVKLISLMRDMYVQIPGYSDNRINAAYQFGGMELLDKTILQNFGVTVNGNMEVDFEGFTGIVDLLGGIEISLTPAEVHHLNDMYDWTLVEGVNHMNGEQALAYSRIRKVGNADYQRTERQRDVMNIIINKIMSLSLSEQLTILDAMLPYLTTDMTKDEILGYCYAVFTNGFEAVEKYRIPANSAFKPASIRGMSVLVPDIPKNQALLKEYILG